MKSHEKQAIDMLHYEKVISKEGYKLICGIDEAGRGPLAGPVAAAAVIFPQGLIIESVNDSKKISEKKREELFECIKEKAISYAVAYASVEEIESMNILNATMLAMKRACESLSVPADCAIIDGNKAPKLSIPVYPLIKGDSLSMSVAAASIMAKVSRDKLMLEYAAEYPEYCFEKHKGYGTALHFELIKKYGPCPIHRLSFLKKKFGDIG